MKKFFFLLILVGVNGLTVIKNLFFKEGFTNCIYSCQTLKKKNFSLEHVIPKSYLPSRLRNDPQNLYPCNREINTKRSNYPFKFKYEKKNPLALKKVLNDGYYIDECFKQMYIRDETKGIVARIILYFYKIYNIQINEILPLKIAIEWDKKYPLKNYELKHNYKSYR
jgi:endonuclease I